MLVGCIVNSSHDKEVSSSQQRQAARSGKSDNLNVRVC